MKMSDENYEMYILEKAINMYLDKTVPFTEEGLNLLVNKHDECVWNIATKIYSQSGHKVGFSVVSDVVNSRIEILKNYIKREKKEESRRIAREKEEEARPIEKETQQRIEKENRRQNPLTELASELDKNGRDKNMSELFLKVQDIVSEKLSVDEDYVTLDSHISNDLGADEFDTVELAMVLEEEFEFEIEIPEDMLGSRMKYPPSYSNSFGDREPAACTVGELLDFIYKQLYS